MDLKTEVDCFHGWRLILEWLLTVENLIVYVDDFLSGLVPGDLVYFCKPGFLELSVHCGICDDRIYGVCHGVDIPVVGFDDIGENFSASALFGYDWRHPHLHCFERRYAERFRYGWHDVDVAGLKHLIDLLAFLESGEVESVGNAAFRSQIYHLVHHIAWSGHDKARVVAETQYLGRGFHEIFRTFLHGDASEESDHFLFGTRNLHIEQFGR